MGTGHVDLDRCGDGYVAVLGTSSDTASVLQEDATFFLGGTYAGGFFFLSSYSFSIFLGF